MDVVGLLFKGFKDCPRFNREEEASLWCLWFIFGDEEARHALILSVLPWTIRIAEKVRRIGIDHADFLSDAILILVRKFDKFDPRRGRLTTFVGQVVYRGLSREIHTNRQIIHIPDYTIKKTVHSADCKAKSDAVRSGVIYLGASSSPAEFLAKWSRRGLITDPEIADSHPDQRVAFRAALEKLDERTQSVLRGRIAGETYDQIGARMKPRISKERVRQICDAAIEEIQVLVGVLHPSKRKLPKIAALKDRGKMVSA